MFRPLISGGQRWSEDETPDFEFTANLFIHTIREYALSILSIQIQGSKKIATRLLDAVISTCSISTSTSTTSTDSRPNFNSRMGHKKTSFV
jgi:hypothetical protein